MKSTKDIAKAIAELQKLQAQIEKIESEMVTAKTLTAVEKTNWEERLDRAYEKSTAAVETALEKAYEKDFGHLVGLYDNAEETLPC